LPPRGDERAAHWIAHKAGKRWRMLAYARAHGHVSTLT
jgi:hypothetical protein